ncbi:MAG: hypothetical protein M3454_04425 [Actinomycetota bacterium]|nr:hypothetical protein [Actinomycetota bacterium]
MFQGVCDEAAIAVDPDHLLQDRLLERILRQPIGVTGARPVAITRRTGVVVVAARAALSRGPDEGAPALPAANDPGQQVVGCMAAL